jgi:hypothetical protein
MIYHQDRGTIVITQDKDLDKSKKKHLQNKLQASNNQLLWKKLYRSILRLQNFPAIPKLLFLKGK